jgi:hypothetical protein
MALYSVRKLQGFIVLLSLAQTEQSCWSSQTSTPVLEKSAIHMELILDIKAEECGTFK